MSERRSHGPVGRRAAMVAIVAMAAHLLHLPLGLAQVSANPIRIAATYTPAGATGPSPTTYFANVDGAALAAGLDAKFTGVIQSAKDGTSTPFESLIPGSAIRSISFSPEPPTAASPLKSYKILQDGLPTDYELRMATYVDNLQPNTLVHTGVVVNTTTGEQMTLTALNDPIPVIAIVGGALVLILCGTGIVNDLVNSCTSQAIKACGKAGVKKVKVKVTFWSLLTGCRSECSYECNPPAAAGKDQAAAPR